MSQISVVSAWGNHHFNVILQQRVAIVRADFGNGGIVLKPLDHDFCALLGSRTWDEMGYCIRRFPALKGTDPDPVRILRTLRHYVRLRLR